MMAGSGCFVCKPHRDRSSLICRDHLKNGTTVPDSVWTRGQLFAIVIADRPIGRATWYASEPIHACNGKHSVSNVSQPVSRSPRRVRSYPLVTLALIRQNTAHTWIGPLRG